MFISTEEKSKITQDIGSMQAALDRMLTDIHYLSAKVKVLEAKPVKKTYKKKKLTAEQRERQREYARKYNAKKRLEKKNATGIGATGV